jgi:DNA-binding YbaB/EbfC family protein
MKDMQRMMKEAQKMAAEMAKAQESLGDIEVEGTAGGGAVKVTASGDLHITSITISPDAFDGAPDADDIEILGDTVTAAVNDALDKARAEQEKVMGPIAGGMGGLGLPGM